MPIKGILGGALNEIQEQGLAPLVREEQRPLKLNVLGVHQKQQIRLILRILQTGQSSSKRDRLLPSPP